MVAVIFLLKMRNVPSTVDLVVWDLFRLSCPAEIKVK